MRPSIRTFRYRLPFLPRPVTTLTDVFVPAAAELVKSVAVSIRTETVHVEDIERETVFQMANGYFVLAAYPAEVEKVRHEHFDRDTDISYETRRVTLLLQRVEKD